MPDAKWSAPVKIEIFPDAASAARAAAVFVAAESRAAIAARGRFVAALSGGSTPWLMLCALAREHVQWDAVQFVQVDERVAPAGDPVLDITEADVALTGTYQGRRRMTLTYPILDRARRVLWLVAGVEKAAALHRLQAGDASIPAGRVRQDTALVFADRSAAQL